jgi:hypothetical protein
LASSAITVPTPAIRYAGWLIASVVFLAFYWRGLECWFFQDDWGWLHIALDPRYKRDVLAMLFAPKAHGNIRPWSENLFFFGLFRLFGVNAVPFRMVVFATVLADLYLLNALVLRLTNSALAAFGSQIFWISNAAIVQSFCWTCIYNETQYLFFVLLALLLFMEGRYGWQIAVFILGLGSLETAVMYPCLVSLYTLLYDRKRLRLTLPLYLISATYTFIHFWAAPAVKTGPYALQIDARIFSTLARYIELALGPESLGHFEWAWPAWSIVIATGLLCVGILACIAAAPKAGLLGAGWFVILLTPVLALPTHISDYLLTGPAMGLAIILGAALASRWRAVSALTAALYLLASVPAAWKATGWVYERSLNSRSLVDGVVEYDRAHPGKQLLLTGMDTDQFFAGFADQPFEDYRMHNVHLAPGADRAIENGGRRALLFLLPLPEVHDLLASGQAVILDVSGGHVHEAILPEH